MNEDEQLNPDDLPSDEETLYVSDFLKEALEQEKVRPTSVDKTDFSQFREDSKDYWNELVEGDSFPEMLRDLLDKSVLLPRHNEQAKTALAYLLLPSALCNRVPILFSQGASGCGKSTLGYIACALHDVPPISAGSTFASIRNTIQTSRVWNPKEPLEQPGNERHCCLIWEDIKPDDLSGNDGNIFSLLKNGVERSGTITIAVLGGENMRFKVFSPKLISSIHPLYARHEFRELVRRLIVIQHKPVMHWNAADYCDSTKDVDSNDLIELSDLNWSGFKKEFREFWEDRERLSLWATTQRKLARFKRFRMNPNDYKMSRDLVCCGVVCGVWCDIESACEHFADYWEWHRNSIESQASATQKALSTFIQTHTQTQAETNSRLIGTPMDWAVKPLEIDAKALKQWCEYLASQGELDSNPTIREINACMNSLGWELKPNSSNRNTWQLANG